MEEQFCTPEIALELNELGFNEPCIAYFLNKNFGMLFQAGTYSNGFKVVNQNYINSTTNAGIGTILAPLWQQAIDFFREKYNWHIIINANDLTSYAPMVNELDDCSCLISVVPYKIYSTFEEAREQVILKCIELCKKKE